MKRQIKFVLVLLFVNFITPVASADIGFQNWLQTFRQQAISEGILPKVFDQSLSGLTPDDKVIALDSNQAEFTRNIWDYLNNATSQARIKKGKALMQKHRRLFDDIEARYGVQREIITAIWAMESDFGRNYGNQNVLRSLATLAYSSQSQKRIKFATKELLLTLQIIQNKKIKASQLVGSWAGAMGQPQFMPSSYLNYGVDYDRDGSIDLWRSLPDVFASIANFLVESGWRKNESWGVEVELPRQFDWRLNSSSYQLRFQQWQDLNIHKIDKSEYQYPNRLASLFIPAGHTGPIFLMSHNFYVIKTYNQSSSYALAVAQLSNLFGLGDKIRGVWPFNDKALSIEQVKRIQALLNSQGHNVGAVDGKIGTKTREAIRTWQLENGFFGDGYANLSFLIDLELMSK